ncbi:MAG: MFS transporter [Polyangia bacterium]
MSASDALNRRDTRHLGFAGKLALLGSLYIAQALPFGFFTQTLPALMRKEGYRLSTISMAAALNLPWALKFLWAPLVDRWPRPTPEVRARRKRWILLMQLASSVAFLAMSAVGNHPTLTALFGGFALLNFISATQDIATDGFAVDMLVGRERGYANGIQVGGYRFGMVLSGGLMLVVLDELGLARAFQLLAALTIVLTIPLLFVREAPPQMREAEAAVKLPHFLLLPGIWRLLVVLATYKAAESLAGGVLRPFLVDRGHSLAEIGKISGIAGSSGGLVGALLGGALASRLPRRAALLIAGLLQSAAVFLFALAASAPLSRTGMGCIFFVEALASSLATATLFTAMMDYSRPLVGSTDYTVQASCIVIATGLSSMVSGRLAEHLGYTTHFVFCGCFGLASLLLLRLLPEPFATTSHSHV